MKFIYFILGILECFPWSIAIALVSAQNCVDPTLSMTSHVISPEPYTYISNDELPKEYDP